MDSELHVKRVYDPPAPGDGCRFLVDRLWPRGISRERLKVDGWLKEVAPSVELRKWFGHDPSRWEDFRQRYLAELNQKPDAVWQPLLEALKAGPVTLLYAAADREHNNAVVLKAWLESKVRATQVKG